jgi:hypothetical protein
VKLICAILISMAALAKGETAPKTVEDRIAQFGDVVRERLEPQFRAVGVPYPPRQVTLVGLKQERILEVHAAGADGAFRLVCLYPILAASGRSGPKLREGDRQVPEGVYRVPELNPNSRFHLSLRLDYPNEFDCARAAEDRRSEPGTDIMIHGDAVSIGCLAVGDPAAEDLFVLAALTGIANVKVILAPLDFRENTSAGVPPGAPAWTTGLYENIKRELAQFPRPKP